MVRGYHVYQSVWSPTAGEQLPCRREPGNIQDPFSVAVMEGSDVVGHVPKKISSICSMFLQRGGTIICEITSTNRRYSVDLPQGGLEVPCILKFEGEEKDISKLDKLIKYANIKKKSGTGNETGEPPEKKVKLTGSDVAVVNPSSPETETISCGRKLSDLHINYAQQLIKKQFPNLNGLQSTLYQSKKQVGGTVKNRLQVIHSQGDHWIVATTVGSSNDLVHACTCIYDSLYTSVDN